MALEDIAMFRTIPKCVVLYPSDPIAAEKAVELAANYVGPVYIRTNRPVSAVIFTCYLKISNVKLQIIYDEKEEFAIGQAKVLKQSSKDKLTIVTSGMTLPESLNAAKKLESEGIHVRIIDLFSVKPIDGKTIQNNAKETEGRILTLEDHYPEGGIHGNQFLSFSAHFFVDAVLSAVAKCRFEVHRLAVEHLPRSGEPHECLDMFGLKEDKIVAFIKKILE